MQPLKRNNKFAKAKVAKINRQATAQKLLQMELERLPPDERLIVERFISRGRIARNVMREFDAQLTFGERIADKVATIGGSWRFIGGFVLFLIVWMIVNSVVLATRAYDPYPFILLNLILSCIAALQAPIIMMSQNRQAEIDRMQAQNDYEVNIKAELEILQLHEKLNELREQDWAGLLEVQHYQTQLLERLAGEATKPLPGGAEE
ncbi:MAG TPA: DUF1003 domain-containing protein [Blastocatellia bacterium]|nr:DUF1003 domain-containing protein [Blastocatellia bacterium]